MENEEANTGNETSSSHAALWIGIAVALLPLIYVLSIAPVAKIAMAMDLPEAPFVVFYSPLVWLVNNNETCQELMMWYFKIWGLY